MVIIATGAGALTGESSGILLGNQDLFLTQKIKVGMTAGTRIDDGGNVPGKIVGIAVVIQRKRKGNLECNLGRSNEFTRLSRADDKS